MADRPYPNIAYVIKRDQTVLQPERNRDKVVEVPRALPANVILVHGVNDVGMGYDAAERGLCGGLQDRLGRTFTPHGYALPGEGDKDKDKVEDDPDAAFFKRVPTPDADSPVIPFYWGYRETKDMAGTRHGQRLDRYGNRLDKDLSKGGGPFGNATSSLPDMWGRGLRVPADPIGDPLRPIKSGPGRMYMVLAACRLAALVSMIRKFAPDDVVNVVAHSQGGLLALLAQAILMEKGERTADTLILTHPPYGLDEEAGFLARSIGVLGGGTDPAMDKAGHYALIGAGQSLHGRLQTLVNIVAGVAASKRATPAFARISEQDAGGMVAGHWRPDGDRDNRGKVYLYFCPEDMTVALDNMRGIGWQGVPEHARGTQYGDLRGIPRSFTGKVLRHPLAELGPHFFQRVFTAKRRPGVGAGKDGKVLVGQPPHEFSLRLAGEDDLAHVAAGMRAGRDRLPTARRTIDTADAPDRQREGIRRITGEALARPCEAELRGSQIDAAAIPASSRLAKVPRADRGPCEEVDPITAAVAVSASDLAMRWEQVPDPSGKTRHPGTLQSLPAHECRQVETAYNAAKRPAGTKPDEHPDDLCRIRRVMRYPDGKVMAEVEESWNEARRRWQHELGEKSFHSAIFDSADNHRRVTAYDVSIGGGKASSHPLFYAYLCAVADWRLKRPKPGEPVRDGILTWNGFLNTHAAYFACEPVWRQQLIEGNVDYYSHGVLPPCLPVLTGKLWNIVIAETILGERADPSTASGSRP